MKPKPNVPIMILIGGKECLLFPATIRSADEPLTTFYKCEAVWSCGWKERN